MNLTAPISLETYLYHIPNDLNKIKFWQSNQFALSFRKLITVSDIFSDSIYDLWLDYKGRYKYVYFFEGREYVHVSTAFSKW